MAHSKSKIIRQRHRWVLKRKRRREAAKKTAAGQAKAR